MPTTLQKVGYVAVGAPLTAARTARERLRQAISDMEERRERMWESFQEEFHHWVEEGERVVHRLEARAEEMTEKAQVESHRLVDTAADVAHGMKAALTEPVVGLEVVPGIGPAYARKMAKAGVLTTAALLERTGTKAETKRLAQQTGIPEASLHLWRASADLSRIKGIGHDFQALLLASGIGTVDALAVAEAGDLADKVRHAAEERTMPQAPSKQTVAKWITEAQHLMT